MQSSTSRRLTIAWRGAAAAALAAIVVACNGVVAADVGRPPTTPPSSPPRWAPARSPGRNPSSASAADLVGIAPWVGRRPTGSAVAACRGDVCEIDFDDDAAIALLPDGALDTFAYSPWWNQLCSGHYARVQPTDTDHLHVGYVDATIDVCIDPENPYDTPVGAFSRGEDCEPIDPVTEPRSSITVGHYANLHGRLDLIDAWGSDYTPRPFTLERMRILSAPARVCYRMPPQGPWVVAEPVGPFDEPGLVYCWSSLTRDCGTCPGGRRERSAWTSPGPAAHFPATTTFASADRTRSWLRPVERPPRVGIPAPVG